MWFSVLDREVERNYALHPRNNPISFYAATAALRPSSHFTASTRLTITHHAKITIAGVAPATKNAPA